MRAIGRCAVTLDRAAERCISNLIWQAEPVPVQAVRAIGRCAVTLERAAERCINVLLELIKQKVNYVVQEAIVVIKDIFRRYPNRCAAPVLRRSWHGVRTEVPAALP